MNSYEVFIHIHQGCFAGTVAIVRLPQCQWSKPDGYGKINQCITTTKHSKAKTVCIFLVIYCNWTKSMTQHRYVCCCIENTSWAPVRNGINSIEFVLLYWSCDVRGLLDRSKLGTNQYIRIQLQNVLWFVPIYQNIQLIYLWRYTEETEENIQLQSIEWSKHQHNTRVSASRVHTLFYHIQDKRVHEWRWKRRSSHIDSVSLSLVSRSTEDVIIDCWWRHKCITRCFDCDARDI